MHWEKSSKIVPLTKELAEDFKSMRPVPGERRLSPNRIAGLRAKYDDGVFHTPTWAFADLGGVRFRVNGNHSSNMLLNLNGSFPATMRVHVMEFGVESVEDLAELFAQFDSKDSARTAHDILTSHGRIHPELEGVSSTNMVRIVAGIAYAMELSKRVGTEERARLIHQHIAFALWANPYVRQNFLSKASVVAAMFLTWGKSSAAASEFWTHVKEESHANNNHPTRVLSRFLREHVGDELKRHGKRWSPQAFHVKCIHAWNAYRRNVSTDLKFYENGGDKPNPV